MFNREVTQIYKFLFVAYKSTDGESVYHGPRTGYIANDLKPVTKYSFKLQAATEGDDSPYSNTVSVVTPESGITAVLQIETKVSFLVVTGCGIFVSSGIQQVLKM